MRERTRNHNHHHRHGSSHEGRAGQPRPGGGRGRHERNRAGSGFNVAGDHEPERLGSDGTCMCPKCGVRTPHRPGLRCQDDQCPLCGAKMLREGSEHHAQYLKKHQEQQSGNPAEDVTADEPKTD